MAITGNTSTAGMVVEITNGVSRSAQINFTIMYAK